MRTYIIRARSGTTRWERVRASIGEEGHFEIVAHCVLNAFFISKDFREDVEVYIVLDSSADFPRTLQLSGGEGLSLSGFHEEAVVELVETALRNSEGLKKDETLTVLPGVKIHGFGFEKLVSGLIKSRPVYLLDRKGDDIRSVDLEPDPVFLLSDHIPLPKNSVKSFERRGLKLISLGRKMLFASQCVVLLNDEMDRAE
jgi:tRNA (pseudouridine54-N1)-methyltransferase